jgi:hypothetical protein
MGTIGKTLLIKGEIIGSGSVNIGNIPYDA